jgi:hypothetical protein
MSEQTKPTSPFRVTASGDGNHIWVGFGDAGPYTLAAHSDHAGVWVALCGHDPQKQATPEVAVCVGKSTGRPVLQVCVPGGEPVTVDLVRAVTVLKRILADEAK